jgi:hypothetical protein
MNEICMTSTAVEMHAAGLKIGVKSVSALNKSDVKRRTTITMVPIMINLTGSVPPKEGAMQEESKPFPMT